MPAELHYASWIADRTIAYLEAHRDEPFFLSCSFPDPHFPLAPPVPYADRYDPAALTLPLPNRGELASMPPHHRYYYEGRVSRIPYSPGGVAGATAKDYPLRRLPEAHNREMLAHYYGLISLCDDAIGRVLDALDRLGLAETTIVLFNADHGELAGDHGLWFKGPFHYESILRVPMLWRWPGIIAPGSAYEGLSSAVDIMPTLLEACGAPPEPGVQGRSALPTLRGATAPYRDWALAEHRERVPGMQTKTLVTERYKLTYYPGQPFGELFDLRDDPWEYENRWDSPAHRAVRDDLLRQLLDVLCVTEDPLPVYRPSPLP
jgi:arylsulfatase A-like enzyme